MACEDPSVLIEAGVDRVLTQYRESQNLLFLLRNYLGKVAEVQTAICDLPEHFDIETAVGDQLTIIGKRLGFPRCHCICGTTPVFGFECDGFVSDYPVVGFCDDGTWLNCGPGVSEICIDDDDLYRSFLKARRYQFMGRFGLDDLTAALQDLYGPAAQVLDYGRKRVVLAPFRQLTQAEKNVLQLVPRVLPVALGVRTRFHFGLFPVFGFGTGWAGFCQEYDDDPILATHADRYFWTEDGDFISAGTYVRDGDWMCEIDVKPYSC